MTCQPPPTLTRCPACVAEVGEYVAADDADTRAYDPSSCPCCWGAGLVTSERARLWHDEHNERHTEPPARKI